MPIKKWRTENPDETWVIENAIGQILGVYGSTQENESPPHLRQPDKVEYMSDSVITRLLETFESDIVFGNLLTPIYFDDSKSPWEKVFELLCHPLVGNPKNTRFLSLETIMSKLESLNNLKLPLQIVIPAFPFKDQNPFRTNASADHVDLGEIVTLIKMHSLALSLFQAYPFGVEWIIVSDGNAYSDIFHIEQDLTMRYQSHLRAFRNRLNLQKSIQIIDMKEMTDRVEGFHEIRSRINSTLWKLVNAHENRAFEEKIDTLARGMRWNLNTRKYLSAFSEEQLWLGLHITKLAEEQLENGVKKLSGLLREDGIRSAIDYLSYNLAMKWLDVLPNFFPHAFRATVHPKSNQIVLPQISDSYPWNGTALVQGDVLDIKSIQIEDYCKIMNRNVMVTEMRLHGNSPPFFYQIL